MNVQVLGDDIYYGASPLTVFQKSRISAPVGGYRVLPVVKAANRFGDDEMMGGLLETFKKIGTGIKTIAKPVIKLVKSPGGKAVGAAALTSIAGRLSPTQKAQLASAQEIIGMSPQVVTGGGTSNIALPVGDQSDMSKNLPLIIGGIGALVVVIMIAMKK